MTTEKVELFDLNDQRVDVIEVPKRQPDQPPRRIIHAGRLFIEGGGEGKYYTFGQFAEVSKDA